MAATDPVLARLGLALTVEPARVIVIAALAAARAVPVFAIAPFFGGRLVPMTIRIACSLALAALVFPAVDGSVPVLGELGAVTLSALLLKEVGVGVVLGFLAALPFLGAEAAGRLADTARGANMAEVLVPQTGTQTSPLGDLAFQLAIVLFLSLDGHLLVVRAFAFSYEALPVAGFPGPAGLQAVADLTVSATAGVVLSALGLAAPVLAALFLVDVSLGLVNRVAPQVPVYFVGMPAKALVGLLAFFLGAAAVALGLRDGFGSAVSDLGRAIRLLGG